MCWEQSRQKRTMATSRSEATTTESSPEKCQRQRPALHCDRWTNKNRRPRQALPLRKNPEGNRFRLTNSFRKGPTMTKGGHLWAIGYNDMGRAEQVRHEIIRLGDKHCLILLDTAVVVRYPDGSVTLDGEPFVAAVDLS